MPSPSILGRSRYGLCMTSVPHSGPEWVTLGPGDLTASSHQLRKPSRCHILLHRLCLHVQGGHFLTIPSHARSVCCWGGRDVFSKRLSTQPRSPATINRTVWWALCRLCSLRDPPSQDTRKWCLPVRPWLRMRAHGLVLASPLHLKMHLSEPWSQELWSRSTNYGV